MFFPNHRKFGRSSFFSLLRFVNTIVKVVCPMNSAQCMWFSQEPLYSKTDKPTPNGGTRMCLFNRGSGRYRFAGASRELWWISSTGMWHISRGPPSHWGLGGFHKRNDGVVCVVFGLSFSHTRSKCLGWPTDMIILNRSWPWNPFWI